jgi:quercetin dioxygenase-like cupin family protein
MKRRILALAAVAVLAGAVSGLVPLSRHGGKTASAQPAPAAPPQMPAEAKVATLFSKDLQDLPSKEGILISVEYPPGCVDPVHRHNAHAFVYVLEGSIIMQVRGGKEVTLKPGDTFYEGPDDIHTVGRNASNTTPARFVVFFVKNKDAPVLVPAQ